MYIYIYIYSPWYSTFCYYLYESYQILMSWLTFFRSRVSARTVTRSSRPPCLALGRRSCKRCVSAGVRSSVCYEKWKELLQLVKMVDKKIDANHILRYFQWFNIVFFENTANCLLFFLCSWVIVKHRCKLQASTGEINSFQCSVRSQSLSPLTSYSLEDMADHAGINQCIPGSIYMFPTQTVRYI